MAANAAAALGLLYAAISVYWGAGGTWLVDTVGGTLARLGRAGDAGVLAAVWGAAVLKLVAAGLPVLAVGNRPPGRRRLVGRLSWIAAAILIVYGGILTAVGLLVQAGVIDRAAHADERALRWHAYLWDPWFLVWGVLIAIALRQAASARPSAARPSAH